MKIIVLSITTVIMSMIGFLLLVRDKKLHSTGNDNIYSDKRVFTKGLIFYSIAMFVITIAASVVFSVFYSEMTLQSGVKNVVLLSVLWPIAYIDYKVYRIPNSYIFMGLVSRVVICFFELFTVERVWVSLLADLIAAIVLLLAAILCSVCVKNSIGYGDIKLFIVMGLFLGLERIWGAIFLSLIVSFFIALILLILRKKSRKDVIPFGPALTIGTYLALLLNVV